MTSEKLAQKFHTDDTSPPRSDFWLVESNFQRGTTNQKHYPDLAWVLTRHHYEISARVSQTSFGRETIGSVAKCRLFSQAVENSKRISSHPLSSLVAQNKDTRTASQTLLTAIRSRLRCRPHIGVRLGTNLDLSANAIWLWQSFAEDFWGRD